MELLSVPAGNTVYAEVGSEVVLKPGAAFVTGSTTNILWKDGGNIAMEWDGIDIDLKRHFAGTLSRV